MSLLLRTGTEVTTTRDLIAILIPDGVEFLVPKNAPVFIQQILGGMFTVQTEDGQLVRIDGRDADALGQNIPPERRIITAEEVLEKGMDACVLEQLKTCYDPEIPVNIVDLGLIYDREIKSCPNNADNFMVRIEMTLTAPGCGMGEILKSDVEKKLRDIPQISEVLVDLVFEPPWESARMSEAAKLKLGFL